MLFSIDNPWKDEADNAHANAVGTVLRYASRFDKQAPKAGTMKSALESFAKDLELVAELFRKNPQTWRHHRALTIVHLPAIDATISGLVNSDMEKSDPRRQKLESDIKACMGLTKPILQGARDLEAMTMEAQTELLMEQTGTVSAEPSKGFFQKGRSLLGQATDTMGAAVTKTGQTLAKSTSLAGTIASETLSSGLDYLTSPVSMRYNALRTSLAETSFLMLFAGGLTAIIFPPAAPLIAGLAVLEAPQAYREAMEEEQKNRAQRLGKKQRTTLSDAVNQLAGKAPTVRLETDHVLVRINTQTGESDGTILSGRYTGQQLSDIDRQAVFAMVDTAPDSQTKQILESWLKGH